MSKIRAVIFDLDDTLYNERQFVEGGFKAVAMAISLRLNTVQHHEDQYYKMLCDVLEVSGRGKVFDIVLKRLSLSDSQFVEDLVEIYRRHEPRLILYPEVFGVLSDLKRQGYKLGLITDGNVDVQRSKLRALRVEAFFDCAVFSDQYGVECRKPNPVSYRKAIDSLKVDFAEAIYIGDNPQKDFISARKLGMYSVRILRGLFKDIRLEDSFEADTNITALDEIFPVLDMLN